MSLTYILGIVIGVMDLIMGIWVAGGSLLMFWDLPSVFITIGGSICSMMVGYPAVRLLKIKDLFKICMVDLKYNYAELILTIVSFSEKSRREGILALEADLEDLQDPFMKMGLQMIVDGNDPELVRKVLEIEIEQMAARHDSYKRMFDDWATFAPAFGMIGTLIGLIQMLQGMDDPTKIGAGMATALVTTLYGSMIANLFALPMAGKLAARSKQEMTQKYLVLEGILSIQSGDNPRLVRERLMTFLAPGSRHKTKED